MPIRLTGSIVSIGPEVQVCKKDGTPVQSGGGSVFTKRLIIDQEMNPTKEWRNYVSIEGNRRGMFNTIKNLDGFNVGQVVNVDINIKGSLRTYKDKDGNDNSFNSLELIHISLSDAVAQPKHMDKANVPVKKAEPTPFEPDQDDLPF